MRVVITGGPGTGKTSIIEYLNKMNFNVFNESSREVTKKFKNIDSDQYFLSNPIDFSNILINKRKMQFEKGSKSKNEYFYYDRGMPDVLAYLNFKKIDYQSSMISDILKFNYSPLVRTDQQPPIHEENYHKWLYFQNLIDIKQMLLRMRQYHHRSNLKHSYL